MCKNREAYESYLRDISQYPRVSREREAALSKIVRHSRNRETVEAAIDELIHSNLFLVVHCLKDFDRFLDSPGINITEMDLIAEGNIALMTAAKNFDADYASKISGQLVRFSSYACGIIRNRMRRALKMARLIHIPEQHFSYWAKIKQLEKRYGTDITDEILMEQLEVGASKLKKLRESLGSKVSMLEDYVNEDGTSRWAEVIPNVDTVSPEAETTRRDMNRYLQEQMDRLPPRTKKMIALAYLTDKGASLGDLSRHFGVSRERCRQVLAKGLKVLRSQIEAHAEKIGVADERRPFAEIASMQTLLQSGSAA